MEDEVICSMYSEAAFIELKPDSKESEKMPAVSKYVDESFRY